MENLCERETNSELVTASLISLPEIPQSELLKDRKTILPTYPDENTIYPQLGVGDVIEIEKCCGNVYYYLCIQRTGQSHTTYRLDEHQPRHYHKFDTYDSLTDMFKKFNTTIHLDPFRLRYQAETSENDSTSLTRSQQTG